MSSVQPTSVSASPAAHFPDEKDVVVPRSSLLQDEQANYSHPLGTKRSLLALCYTQIGLLCLAEYVVSFEAATNGRQTPAETWQDLGRLLHVMPRFKKCLWMAFTVYDVITLCMTLLEVGQLHDNASKWATGSLKVEVVVLQMVSALIWVHGGAAWAVLHGPSTFGEGPDTVNWMFDVMVPLALNVTFFFTFVWNMSRFCKIVDEMSVEDGFEEGEHEYEIKL